MSEFHPSVCPHDCPSRVRARGREAAGRAASASPGRRRNRYTAGVICAKVARYHERFHHPDRLGYPLRRKGPKGSGEFERIGWDEALDAIAEAFLRAEQRHGSRDGLALLVRRHDGPRAARRHPAARAREALLAPSARSASKLSKPAGRGPREALGGDPRRDGRARGPGRRVGQQPGLHPGQPDDPRRPGPKGARGEAGGGRPLPQRDGRAGRHAPRAQAGDGRGARLRRDARPVQGGLRRPRLPGALQRRAGRAGGAPRSRTPEWAAAVTGLKVEEILAFARLYGSARRSYLRLGYGFTRSRNGAPRCTPPPACRSSPAHGSTRAAGRSTTSATSTVSTRR